MKSLYEQAEIEEESGNLGIAIDLWKRLLRESPQPSTFCRLGLALQQLCHWAEAESAFREALKIDVSSVEAMECLGILGLERMDLSDTEGLEQAEQWLTRSIKFERSSDTLSLLGLALKTQGKHEQAKLLFLEAIDRDPDNLESILNLAAIEAMTDHERAISMYERAIQIDPENASAHQQLGVLKEKHNALVEARYHFERSIEIDPIDVWSHLYLANLLAVEGESDAAQSEYQKALDLDASSKDTRRFYATFLRSVSKMEEADSLIDGQDAGPNLDN